jgi:hypothetical protein
MNNKKFIKVDRSRFYEIFKDSVYVSHIQKNLFEWTSCPYYNIIDNRTKEIVGIYSDGSWENTFEVIIELASKEDIIIHYENLLKYKENELKRSKQEWKKLKEYKDLSEEDRALYDQKEQEEKERRKTHPGLMSFMEDVNIIKYDPYNTLIADEILKTIFKK